MSDIIKISKSELERLVAIEIAKRTLPIEHRDFRDVAISNKEIVKANKQHPVIDEKLKHTYTGPYNNDIHSEELRGFGRNNYSIFKRNRSVSGFDRWAHAKISYSDVHETLRKLSIQLMGVSIIRDLEPDELNFALDVYEDFKQFFLEKYNQRLNFEEERNND